MSPELRKHLQRLEAKAKREVKVATLELSPDAYRLEKLLGLDRKVRILVNKKGDK